MKFLNIFSQKNIYSTFSLGKKMLYRFILLCSFLLFCHPAYSNSCDVGQQTIKLTNTSISCDELEGIYLETQVAVEAIQYLIMDIADNKNDYANKLNNYIPTALKFLNENATIQITSLSHPAPKTVDVGIYLKNLAALARTKYLSVKITYLPENTIFIVGINRGRVALDIVTFQDFKGCANSEQSCYHDVTRKVFHASFTKQANSTLEASNIRINGITAEDTWSYQDFENKKNKIIEFKK